MQDFKQLEVWKRGHQLTLSVYKATQDFPKDELYGLTGQLRRAASSIPANIAEGCGRGGENELARFLRISMGSASELEYHLLLAHDLGLMDTTVYGQLNQELATLKRMMNALLQKIKSVSDK